MKRFALLTILFFLSTGRAGADLTKSGGRDQKVVLLAYANLEKFIDMCAASPFCQLADKEKQALGKIRSGLAEEKRAANQIQFRSGIQEPGFFIVDKQPRLAKTGDKVGAPIFVDSDSIAGISLPAAVSMLVHELGHHQSIKDHQRLETLGLKIQTAMLATRSLAYVAVTIGDRDVMLAAELYPLTGGNAAFIVHNESSIIDLADRLAAPACTDAAPQAASTVKGLNFPYDGHSISNGNSNELVALELEVYLKSACRSFQKIRLPFYIDTGTHALSLP